VIGDAGKAAIVCDGDHWNGAEAYARDLAHERNLQRCGWRIFRVRESAFYVDQDATVAALQAFLDECGISPVSQAGDDGAASETDDGGVAPEDAAAAAGDSVPDAGPAVGGDGSALDTDGLGADGLGTVVSTPVVEEPA